MSSHVCAEEKSKRKSYKVLCFLVTHEVSKDKQVVQKHHGCNFVENLKLLNQGFQVHIEMEQEGQRDHGQDELGLNLEPRLITEHRNAYCEYEHVPSEEEEYRVDDALNPVRVHSAVDFAVFSFEVWVCHSFEIDWVEYRYEDRQAEKH